MADPGSAEWEALAVIDGALGIAELPAPAAGTLRATRRWLLVLTGQPWTQDGEALLARAAAAGDRSACPAPSSPSSPTKGNTRLYDGLPRRRSELLPGGGRDLPVRGRVDPG